MAVNGFTHQLIPQSSRVQQELRASKDELKRVTEEIKKMQVRKREIEQKISSLKSELSLINDEDGAGSQYDREDFPWSKEMKSNLKSVFKIEEFRSHQKAAINATMSKLDCLLIMPTGGGKSLCFQLPAVLSPGVTLVVSPLISLMEDQLQALQALNISTALFNSQTDREQTKYIMSSMIDKNSTLKLLYVTPEKLAKSKRLLSQLEKMYRAQRFARLVIDEVHCCSQWGHDFRPDYKFLGIMKNQFPNTPIIGLTATATASVIVDVQKILNIEGCLMFKDSFFRPNLKYEVKDVIGKDKVEDIAEVIKCRFPNQSGIIYCLTIKDCEDVAEKLWKLGIKADRYHATLEPEMRTKIQQKWYNNVCQVIVATVAFGMGINKLDVRFVIHYSMSKSVENYYQETGRAGRDGNVAYCILYYRFQDTFRASSLMFSEKNGVQNVYNMLRYSLDRDNCRKAAISEHFGDRWNKDWCNNMCDNCENKSLFARRTVINSNSLLDDIMKLLNHSVRIEERMTALKLMDAWFSKGNKLLRLDDVPVPKYSREVCERVVALLLIDGYLKEEFHFTPYSVISYIVPGSKVHFRETGNEIIYSITATSVKSNKEKTARKSKEQSTSIENPSASRKSENKDGGPQNTSGRQRVSTTPNKSKGHTMGCKAKKRKTEDPDLITLD